MHDQRVARAAEVRADLLAPLEGRVPGPRPCRAVVGVHDGRAPLLQPAVELGQLELHLVGQRDAVLHRQLVERTGDRSFHAGAVVTPDPDDQGVVELTELLDRVDHATDVVVGVLGVPRVHLHLARVEPLQLVGQVVPRRERLVARRELRIRGDDAELLLAREGLLAELVPALVEHPRVPVGPLARHVVRSVAAAGREVHEERLVSVLRTDTVQPLDRVVGHGVWEVVRIVVVVEPRVRADDLLVLGQTRIPLARATAEDPVEVVEAPPVRPPVERPGRPLVAVRGQVPLPDRRRAVAVVPQDPRQRRAVPRQQRGVAREPSRELADRPEADRVVVPPGQQRRAGGGAQRRDVEPVVAQPSLRDTCVVRRLDRAAEGARVPEPGVVDEDQQDVRCAFRCGRMRDEVPIRLRSVERPIGGAVERLPADGEAAAIDFAHRHVLPRSPARSWAARARWN